MVLSDYFGNYGYMNAERAIRGGTGIMLDAAGNSSITDTTSGTSLQAMRQACKDIFYTTVNSAAYENDAATAIPTWLMVSYIVEGAVVAALVLAEVLLIRGFGRKKQTVWKGVHHHKVREGSGCLRPGESHSPHGPVPLSGAEGPGGPLAISQPLSAEKSFDCAELGRHPA